MGGEGEGGGQLHAALNPESADAVPPPPFRRNSQRAACGASYAAAFQDADLSMFLSVSEVKQYQKV